MVWGMFSRHYLGSLIIVEGTMDQYKYTSVLTDHVLPYMCIVFPQDDGIYQQGNAKCYTAGSARARETISRHQAVGGQRVIKEKERSKLSHLVMKNWCQLAAQYDVGPSTNVSEHKVQQVLLDMGLHSRRPICSPLLTKRH
ncbi:transposable element Tcb1 transposase [Trichonephila clavipes]|uniref:Transposable element Tcb1 transposase n=1 Tax=Trichonephila clavipes TaxID=2585209 RepID=A0A8X6SF24_TRICX|nr:transposable element Tcb1 transposase [Trichonephila clavipes]